MKISVCARHYLQASVNIGENLISKMAYLVYTVASPPKTTSFLHKTRVYVFFPTPLFFSAPQTFNFARDETTPRYNLTNGSPNIERAFRLFFFFHLSSQPAIQLRSVKTPVFNYVSCQLFKSFSLITRGLSLRNESIKSSKLRIAFFFLLRSPHPSFGEPSRRSC